MIVAFAALVVVVFFVASGGSFLATQGKPGVTAEAAELPGFFGGTVG